MPLRKLTPDELQELSSRGYDISQLPEQINVEEAEGPSKIQAIKSTLAAHKGSILGGGAGALAGGAALTGLGLAPFTAGISIPVSLLGSLGIAGAGLAASYAGQKAQQAIEGDEKTKQLQAEYEAAQQAHPITTAVTDIGASGLASGGFPSIANPVRAGVGAIRGIIGKSISEAQKAALKNVAVQSLVNPAINAGLNLATTGELPSGKDFLEQAAGGALMSGQNPLGRMVGMPHATEKVEPTAEPTRSQTVEEPKTTIPNTPFNTKTPTGDYLIDNEAVRQAYKAANPKPDTTGMSDTDAYVAQTEWRRKMKLSDEEQRNALHSSFAEQQGKSSIETTPAEEVKGEVTNKTVPAEKPPEEKIDTIEPQVLSPQEQEELQKNAEGLIQGDQKKYAQQSKYNLTKRDAEEVEHKLWVLHDSDELLKDYGITQQDAKDAIKSIPKEGGEWTIPSHTLKAVKDEMLNHSYVLRDMANNARENNHIAESLILNKQAAKFERMFGEGDINAKENPTPQSELQRYTEIQDRLKQLIKDQSFGGEEFHNLWKESESIKNRNGGMPPENVPIKKVGPTNVGQHIQNLLSDPKFKDYHGILSAISLDNKSLSTPVEPTSDRSHYSLTEDKIYQNPDNTPAQHVEEIIHAATSLKLPTEFEGKRGYKLKGAMDEYLKTGNNEHVKELVRSYIETAKQLGLHGELFGEDAPRPQFGKRGVAGAPDLAEHAIPIHGYSMGDLHEFIAHALSNDVFQYHLNELPSGLNNGKSMWNRLLEGIRKLLGIPVKEGSMLERVLGPADKLISEERPENKIHKIEPTTSYEDFEKQLDNITNKRYAAKSKDEIPPTREGGFIGRTFRPMVDSIRAIDHPAAKEVGDAFHRVLEQRQHYVGTQLNPILEAARKLGLSEGGDKHLENAMRYERETGKNAPETLFRSPAERQVFQIAKQSLKANFTERFNNEEPVYRNGQPTMPRRDEFYWPTTTNPKIAEIYRKNTDQAAIAKLDKTFLDYQTKLHVKPEEAKENLDNFKKATQAKASTSSSLANNQFFNASRRSEGVPLPPEFTRPGFLKNLEAYFHRQATDNAYYKHIESNPKVMSALGETKDAWNRPIEPHPNGSLAGNTAVRTQLNQIKGEVGGAGYHNEKAASSLATTLFIGPGTTIHKAISNLIGMTNYADNPYQLTRMLASSITGAEKGLKHALENGVVKMTARSYKDLWSRNATMADRLRAVAQGIRGVYSLADLTDRWGAGLMQAGIEHVLPAKIEKANKGDVTQQQLLRRIDPSYKVGKSYDESGISKLASGLVGSIHGTLDGRTMPTWMSGDSEISGFFHLSNWGISQTNRFMTDIYTPATNGNYTPLITALFGSAAGGYLIKELRERLQGKKGQIPSLAEIDSSSKGLSDNIPLLGYNLMASLSYAGFGGMLSQFAKAPMDWVHKNTSQGMVFPLDELATDTVHTMHQAATAIANDPNLNWLELTKFVSGHILTTNFQLGRVVYNQLIDNGLITGTLAEKKILADKMSQLRRFDMVEKLPYEELDASGNPYMNLEQKKFKLEPDIQKAASMVPDLVHNIIEKYGDKPDVMMSKLKGLKENSYATFPSMESTPLSFIHYISYLKNLKGDDAAQEALMDFLHHKVINEAKGSLVP